MFSSNGHVPPKHYKEVLGKDPYVHSCSSSRHDLNLAPTKTCTTVNALMRFQKQADCALETQLL